MRCTIALALVVSCCGGAVAATPGSQLAAACSSCHRSDIGESAIPLIAGQNEEHIVQLMLAYRSGLRSSQIMQVVAGALSPEEITDIAHFLAAQKSVAVQ